MDMKRLAVVLIVIIIVSVLGIYIVNTGITNIGIIEQTDLFVAKGHAHYRIPSIVVAKDGTVLAFCNRRLHTVGDNAAEVHVVLRRSLDGDKTWRISRVVNEGPSGYSSLAVSGDGTILCMYETGKNVYNEKIVVARFNMDWLMKSDNRLKKE